MKLSLIHIFFGKNEVTEYGIFYISSTGLKTVVTAIGAGVAVWGVINLLEGYGNDNPGAKSQGVKQLMACLLYTSTGDRERELPITV